MGLAIAIAAIFLIGGACVAYEVYFKELLRNKKSSGSSIFSNQKIEHPTAGSTASTPKVSLTASQAKRLFGTVLPKYVAQAPAGKSVLCVDIGGVGAWTIDAAARTVVAGKKTADVTVGIKDLATLNDILSQSEFSEGYFVGLYLKRQVTISGDKAALADFKGIIQLIGNNRDAIAKETLA